jgi:hypothetical protein
MTTSNEKYRIDLTNRQIEINEWSYNNKMDTLFVFQLLFISLLFASILIALNKQGIVGAPFVWYSVIVVALIDIIIIINRSIYTNNWRDQRFWNKRHFSDDNKLASPVSQANYVNVLQQAGSKNSCNCN